MIGRKITRSRNNTNFSYFYFWLFLLLYHNKQRIKNGKNDKKVRKIYNPIRTRINKPEEINLLKQLLILCASAVTFAQFTLHLDMKVSISGFPFTGRFPAALTNVKDIVVLKAHLEHTHFLSE